MLAQIGGWWRVHRMVSRSRVSFARLSMKHCQLGCGGRACEGKLGVEREYMSLPRTCGSEECRKAASIAETLNPLPCPTGAAVPSGFMHARGCSGLTVQGSCTNAGADGHWIRDPKAVVKTTEGPGATLSSGAAEAREGSLRTPRHLRHPELLLQRCFWP